MPTPEIERAMAEGAARSRAALAPAASLTGRLRDLWASRKWWLIGIAILVLIEIVAGLAASASSGHF